MVTIDQRIRTPAVAGGIREIAQKGLSTMLCPCCRQNVGEEEKFCGYCGITLQAAADYLALLKMAAADGHIDASERAQLDQRAQALSLSQEQCQAIEAGVPLQPTAKNQGHAARNVAGPAVIRLSINSNRLFVSATAGVLQYQLMNMSGMVLEDIEVVAKIGNSVHRLTEMVDYLPPGQQESVFLGFDIGDMCGFVLVGVEIRLRANDELRSYSGQHEIQVFARPTTGTNINFGTSVNKVQINNEDGGVLDASDMKMGGSDRAADIKAAFDAGLIADVNQFLRQWGERPPAYVEVPLRAVQKRPGKKALSCRFSKSAEATPQLSLSMGDEQNAKTIHLFVEPEVRFGRDRSNTLVFRCLPRNEQNDQLSRKISSIHGTFSWQADGCCVEDRKSQNGTTVDGRPVDHQLTALHNGQMISIGKALQMRISTCGVPVGFDKPVYDNTFEFLWSRNGGSMLGAVRLERIGNLQNESYILLHDVAVIGSSQDAAVFIVGLSPVHAYLLAGHNSIWIEAAVDGGVIVDGVVLQSGELVCLAAGMKIKLGSAEIVVGERKQLHL